MGVRDNPIIYLTKKMWQYSASNRFNAVLYITLSTISNIISFFVPLILAKIINIIQEEGVYNDNLWTIIGYILLFFFVWVLFWAFHGPARVLEKRNAFIVQNAYKDYLITGTLDLPAEWHVDHHSGETIDKIEKGSKALSNYSEKFYEVIGFAISLVSSFAILVYFHIYSAFIVAGIFVITIYIILQFDRTLVKKYKIIFGIENEISAKIFDSIANITTIIILRVEKLVQSAIYKKMMSPIKVVFSEARVNETKWFVVSCCSSLMTVLVLGTYIYREFNAGGIILAGTVVALYQYLDRISDSFFHFAYRYGDIVRWRSQVGNAEVLSNAFRKSKKVPGMRLDGWKQLDIKDLRFSYHADDGADLHLDGISLTVFSGQRIALIGDSGSGKTTFLKVFRDLFHPRKVSVSVDGRELADGFATLSPNIALIPQDPEIFNTTIRENITLGVTRTIKNITRFTDMAEFTPVITRLPHGLESHIVEKGVNLSGGEKQRLALARGLLACENKSIILLDEPTSSVDTRNELSIYKNIFRNFKDKTIISSIHRLHLLPMFDNIFYFQNGKIIAQGSFKDLLKNKDFNNLWKKYQKSHKE